MDQFDVGVLSVIFSMSFSDVPEFLTFALVCKKWYNGVKATYQWKLYRRALAIVKLVENLDARLIIAGNYFTIYGNEATKHFSVLLDVESHYNALAHENVAERPTFAFNVSRFKRYVYTYRESRYRGKCAVYRCRKCTHNGKEVIVSTGNVPVKITLESKDHNLDESYPNYDYRNAFLYNKQSEKDWYAYSLDGKMREVFSSEFPDFKNYRDQIIFIVYTLMESQCNPSIKLYYWYHSPSPYPPLSLFKFCSKAGPPELHDDFGLVGIKCGYRYQHTVNIDLRKLSTVDDERIISIVDKLHLNKETSNSSFIIHCDDVIDCTFDNKD
jgi:hypothetical protein